MEGFIHRIFQSQSDCRLQDTEVCGQISVQKVLDASWDMGRAAEAETPETGVNVSVLSGEQEAWIIEWRDQYLVYAT